MKIHEHLRKNEPNDCTHVLFGHQINISQYSERPRTCNLYTPFLSHQWKNEYPKQKPYFSKQRRSQLGKKFLTNNIQHLEESFTKTVGLFENIFNRKYAVICLKFRKTFSIFSDCQISVFFAFETTFCSF